MARAMALRRLRRRSSRCRRSTGSEPPPGVTAGGSLHAGGRTDPLCATVEDARQLVVLADARPGYVAEPPAAPRTL